MQCVRSIANTKYPCCILHRKIPIVKAKKVKINNSANLSCKKCKMNLLGLIEALRSFNDWHANKRDAYSMIDYRHALKNLIAQYW